GSDANFFNYGNTFAHELAERMSDPMGGGVLVSAPPSLPASFLSNPGSPASDPSNWEQIGDFEPEPANQDHYTYRIGGPSAAAIVQPIWSRVDQAFIVADGNSERFTLTPIWTGIGGSNPTFTHTYNLTINGDQLANKNDSITISRDAAGGVE